MKVDLVKWIINLKNKKFVQDSALLQAGSAFSIILSLVASIVYARVLGVSGYSDYALIFAFVGLLSVFMNIGTNPATLTLMSEAYARGDKTEVKNLLSFYLKATVLIYIAAGMIIILLAPILTSRLYQNANIGGLARIVIMANILKLFFDLYIIALQVLRKIKMVTFIETIEKFFYIAFPVSLVLTGWGIRGLVSGYFLEALIFMIFTFFAYKRLVHNNDLLPSWREIIFNKLPIRKLLYFFRFGFLIALDKNIGNFYTSLPIFILGIFYINEVSFIKIAIAYGGLPLILIGPISRLLMVQLPKAKVFSPQKLKENFFHSAVGSFLIVLSMTMVFTIIAPWLIPLFYGAQYSTSIHFAYPFLFGSLIVSAGVGISSVFRTLNLMKKSIIINTTAVVLGAPTLYLSTRFLPLYISAWVMAFWLPAVTLFCLGYIARYFHKYHV